MARMNSVTRVALFLLSSLSYSTQKQSHSLLYSNPNLGLPLSPSLCLYSIETQTLFRSSKQEQNQPTHRRRRRASCVFRRPFFALTRCTVTQALEPQISSIDNQGVTCQWLIPPLVQATMVACSKIEVANVAKKQPLRYQTQKNPRRLYFKCADGKCKAWWAPTTQHGNASNIQWRPNLIPRKNEDEGRNDSNRNNES